MKFDISIGRSTARATVFYIREYEEETNLRCNVLLDASGSMAYEGTRTEGRSKLHYASRLAACLSYMMLKQTDSVGLVTFDTKGPQGTSAPRGQRRSRQKHHRLA